MAYLGSPGSIAHRHGGLGGQALTPQLRVHVVADLDERVALDILDRQATVPDEPAVMLLDDPQAEPVLDVVASVPGDPALCVGACAASMVRPRRVERSQYAGHVVQVGVGHLAEPEARGRGGDHPAEYACGFLTSISRSSCGARSRGRGRVSGQVSDAMVNPYGLSYDTGMANVVTTGEARDALHRIAQGFDAGEGEPVYFGSHRRAQAVIVPVEVWERLLEHAEDELDTDLAHDRLTRDDGRRLSRDDIDDVVHRLRAGRSA